MSGKDESIFNGQLTLHDLVQLKQDDLIMIDRQFLIKLVKDAFTNGFMHALDRDSFNDSWRVSYTKEELEKITNEEYIHHER